MHSISRIRYFVARTRTILVGSWTVISFCQFFWRSLFMVEMDMEHFRGVLLNDTLSSGGSGSRFWDNFCLLLFFFNTQRAKLARLTVCTTTRLGHGTVLYMCTSSAVPNRLPYIHRSAQEPRVIRCQYSRSWRCSRPIHVGYWYVGDRPHVTFTNQWSHHWIAFRIRHSFRLGASRNIQAPASEVRRSFYRREVHCHELLIFSAWRASLNYYSLFFLRVKEFTRTRLFGWPTLRWICARACTVSRGSSEETISVNWSSRHDSANGPLGVVVAPDTTRGRERVVSRPRFRQEEYQ
jgi:hypothetical protein